MLKDNTAKTDYFKTNTSALNIYIFSKVSHNIFVTSGYNVLQEM